MVIKIPWKSPKKVTFDISCLNHLVCIWMDVRTIKWLKLLVFLARKFNWYDLFAQLKFLLMILFKVFCNTVYLKMSNQHLHFLTFCSTYGSSKIGHTSNLWILISKPKEAIVGAPWGTFARFVAVVVITSVGQWIWWSSGPAYLTKLRRSWIILSSLKRRISPESAYCILSVPQGKIYFIQL